MRSPTSSRPPRWRLLPCRTGLVALTVAAAGCAGGSGAAAGDVALGFHAAVADGDGATACGLLAPQTRRELAQSARQPCPVAVLEEELPRVTAVRGSSVFGSQAQVRLEGDTVFLAEFPRGWRVVAAGCSPRPPLPYDCRIKGV